MPFWSIIYILGFEGASHQSSIQLWICKIKAKNFAGFKINVKNQILLEANFENLIIHKSSLGSCEVPQQIGSAVLTYIGYKKKRQTTWSMTSKVYI